MHSTDALLKSASKNRPALAERSKQKSHQHAQKKNRIDMQQVERSPAALPAVERNENTPPANSPIREQTGGLSRELAALCADASPSSGGGGASEAVFGTGKQLKGAEQKPTPDLLYWRARERLRCMWKSTQLERA